MGVQDKLLQARCRLVRRYPYFAAALGVVRWEEDEVVGSMGVTPAWVCRYNPAWVASLTLEELEGVVCHELFHLLWRHAQRLAGRHPRLWNVAGDAAINRDLRLDGVVLPSEALYPETLDLPPQGTTEEYYDLLLRQGEEDLPQGWGGGDLLPSGEEGEEPPEVWVALQEVGKAMARAGHGLSPGVRALKEALFPPSQVDWRRLLQFHCRRQLHRGGWRYDYGRPSRRAQAVWPVVLPGKAPEPRLGVAALVDVSGSIAPDVLQAFLQELEPLARQVAFLEIVGWDEELRWRGSLSQVKKMTSFPGGGGTDLAAGLEYVKATYSHIGVVVVLTDGHTPWPPRPLGVPVVVVTTDIHGPAWAVTVEVGYES